MIIWSGSFTLAYTQDHFCLSFSRYSSAGWISLGIWMLSCKLDPVLLMEIPLFSLSIWYSCCYLFPEYLSKIYTMAKHLNFRWAVPYYVKHAKGECQTHHDQCQSMWLLEQMASLGEQGQFANLAVEMSSQRRPSLYGFTMRDLYAILSYYFWQHWRPTTVECCQEKAGFSSKLLHLAKELRTWIR